MSSEAVTFGEGIGPNPGFVTPKYWAGQPYGTAEREFLAWAEVSIINSVKRTDEYTMEPQTPLHPAWTEEAWALQEKELFDIHIEDCLRSVKKVLHAEDGGYEVATKVVQGFTRRAAAVKAKHTRAIRAAYKSVPHRDLKLEKAAAEGKLVDGSRWLALQYLRGSWETNLARYPKVGEHIKEVVIVDPVLPLVFVRVAAIEEPEARKKGITSYCWIRDEFRRKAHVTEATRDAMRKCLGDSYGGSAASPTIAQIQVAMVRVQADPALVQQRYWNSTLAPTLKEAKALAPKVAVATPVSKEDIEAFMAAKRANPTTKAKRSK